MSTIAIANPIANLTEDQLWQAWERKDATYDGQFYVAVRTTRIYCRPSCSARPLRKNVLFFAGCDEAEAAGYRPCKRCHPREAALPDTSADLVKRAVELIEAQGSARLDDLGNQLNVSPFHLQRTFKKIMGVSPLKYAHSLRQTQMKAELKTGANVTTAIYNAGFSSSSRVYEDGSVALGMPPSQYQRGGRGMHIAYTLLDCALGRMLMAGTPRGICAIYFGESDAEMEQALMKEYPRAEIERHENTLLSDWAQAVLQYLNQGQPYSTLTKLPIDVQGTAFQAMVWQALRQIPPGATWSYSDVAKAIGQPTAMRAVANACGANRVSVVIPCHRVVREDGAVGGYRWGSGRKTKLLAAERR